MCPAQLEMRTFTYRRMQRKAGIIKMERKLVALIEPPAEVLVMEYVTGKEDLPAFKLRAAVLVRGS